jgi:hypothetical protein
MIVEYIRYEIPDNEARIEWDSAKEQLKGFRANPEFRISFNAVRPYVDRIEETRHYEVKTTGPKQSNNAR